MKCQARQYSDQMHCYSCGLVWDTNDPEPPTCREGKKGMTAEEARVEVAALLAPYNQPKVE